MQQYDKQQWIDQVLASGLESEQPVDTGLAYIAVSQKLKQKRIAFMGKRNNAIAGMAAVLCVCINLLTWQYVWQHNNPKPVTVASASTDNTAYWNEDYTSYLYTNERN